MEEARAVLNRLERIERLDHRGAPAPILLNELRALVAEAEAWVQAEQGPTDRAEGALARLREAVRSEGRTLLA